MDEKEGRWRILGAYFVLTYATFLVNTAFYLKYPVIDGAIQCGYLAAVWLTYSFIYLAGPMALIAAWSWLTMSTAGERMGLKRLPAWLIVGAPAVVLFGLVHLYFFADRFVYGLYKFHLHNGFVRNLVLTPGGIESMGSDTSTNVTFGLLTSGFLTLQWILLALAWRLGSRRDGPIRLVRLRPILRAVGVLVILGLLERGTYALSSLKGYTPVLSSAETLPFYLRMTVGGLARKLGIQSARSEELHVSVGSDHLKYPLQPIRKAEDRPKYNIVWLVSESLRWDMLDPEIMPATHAFGKRAARYLNHFSGGNGTRMGVFSMFYGLYGPYWFSFLNERRGPVLVDLILEDNYQLELFTSARFTYPEFDKTVWARVPREKLHESELRYGWEKDRENVGRILKFIDDRDPSRPFFTFEFFESPHARYYFPPECEIRKPYLETFNYATFDPSKDIDLVKNRYINSCRHLDTQIERILKNLESHGLLDKTIIVITGDHGEEFMEHGMWGHNSKFHEEQIRTPLVIWIPGKPPVEVTRMTSHLDIAPTILKSLGVENPEADFALGHDLFGPTEREYTVLAGWDDLAILDDRFTAVYPLQGVGLGDQIERTPEGYRAPKAEEFQNAMRPRMKEVLQDLKKFTETKSAATKLP